MALGAFAFMADPFFMEDPAFFMAEPAAFLLLDLDLEADFPPFLATFTGAFFIPEALAILDFGAWCVVKLTSCCFYEELL